MNKFTTWIVAAVLLYVVFIHQLSNIPKGIYVDEVITGYNAYSIAETKQDEYGKTFPIAFRLLGSYSPPLYIYLSSAAVKCFSLSVFSTRIVSALSGIGSTIVIFFFLRELKFKQTYFLTFLYLTSPWVIFFSRAGYEIYFGYTLFLLGVYFAYKSLGNIKFLPISYVVMSLATYGSHTTRFLSPLWLLIFHLFFFNKLIPQLKSKIAILGVLVALIIQIPNLAIINSTAFWSKNNLFYTKLIINRAEKLPIPEPINFLYAFAYEFGARLTTYLSPKSLFFVGDPDPQRSIPELSVFYNWMVIPYLIGIYILVKNIKKPRNKLTISLLIAAIPASLTHDPFTTQRAIPVFLPLYLIIASGVSVIIERFNRKTYKYLIYIFTMIYSSIILWRSYFVLFPAERALAWGYGYSELFEKLKNFEDEQIVIDNSRSKPMYPYYLFVNKYSPNKVQQVRSQKNLEKNYYETMQYDYNSFIIENVQIRPVVWETDIYEEKIIVGDAFSISLSNISEHKLSMVFEIKDNDGNIIFHAYRTNPKEKELSKTQN